MSLYRVKVGRNTMTVFADDAMQAQEKARKSLSALVRPATEPETFEWLNQQLALALAALEKIENDCQ